MHQAYRALMKIMMFSSARGCVLNPCFVVIHVILYVCVFFVASVISKLDLRVLIKVSSHALQE